jgi:dipeptidyl aminopeptidase/acylaminoacyl peptidase
MIFSTTSVEFFTCRGLAVADVDYRGSTGYGRAYRQALSHLCGIADAKDCITVAHWLADSGRADPTRVVISGASAGGFTALRTLIFSDVFAAASCVSGIVDLLEFHRRTHKFQRHELDRLVGPLPERLPSYESRSPSNLVDEIDRPIFLAHGLDDPVVPAAAVRGLAQALRARGTPMSRGSSITRDIPRVGPRLGRCCFTPNSTSARRFSTR